MFKETIFGKLIDFFCDLVIKFLVYVLKICSPIRICPKKILKQDSSQWNDILNMKIENRLNDDLYDIRIIGLSKNLFSINIISDSGPNKKTVQYMNINTDRLVVYGRDKNGNYFWFLRIHKLGAKETVSLDIKMDNKEDVFFGLSGYSKKEVFIKEKKNGVVAIPFKIDKFPRIR